MLREEARYFSTRYDDVVREPDATWIAWVGDGAVGIDKALFVAEDGADWLGVVGGFGRLDRAEVQLISLWIDPRARGRGAARALIRAVAEWARDRGAKRVVLFVQEANAPGRALYTSAGFLPTGDRAPVGAGRPGFKLVLAAPVDSLLA